MEIKYCDKWWLSKKRPVKVINEKEAKQRHEKKKAYVALLSENDKIQYIVNITEEWVSVTFLDNLLRPYLKYDFEKIKDKEVFLSAAIFWEYEGDDEKECLTRNFSFSYDGETIMSEHDKKNGALTERIGNFSIDANKEFYPEFGEYLHLCKVERE